MSRAALAFKARTGRAVLVALAGDGHDAVVIERSQFPLLPAGEMAPYHAAQPLPPQDAHRHVVRSIETAQRFATQAIRDAAARCVDAHHQICGCAVLVGAGMPEWTTAEIIAVHVRMHQAEGELFRRVLLEGVRACGFALTTLPAKSPIESAAKALDVTRGQLDAQLAALGKSAGAPWGAEQKEATAAALVVLGGFSRR